MKDKYLHSINLSVFRECEYPTTYGTWMELADKHQAFSVKVCRVTV